MVRFTHIASAILIVCADASSPFNTKSWGIVGNIPRGGDASYSSVCEDVKSGIVAQASKDVSYIYISHASSKLHQILIADYFQL